MFFRIADWLKAIVLIAILFAVYSFSGVITHTILLFILAGLVTFITVPLVNTLVSKGAYRIVAIFLTYSLFFAVLLVLAAIFAPIVVEQVSEFAQNIPDYVDSLIAFAERVQEQLQEIPFLQQIPFDPDELILQATAIVTEQLRTLVLLIPSLILLITDIVLILILSFYMLFYLPQIDKTIKRSLPLGTIGVYDKFLVTMKSAFGRYVLGQLSLMFAVGTLSGIGVWLVGLPFPLLLGLWAGLTEIIPILGPILGAIPAVIIAFTIDPILALWVILIFVVVQQIESGILSPLIFRGASGINPLLIILAIIAGGEIAGIIGIFLAVPILVVIVTLFRFIRDNFEYVRAEPGPDKISVKD